MGMSKNIIFWNICPSDRSLSGAGYVVQILFKLGRHTDSHTVAASDISLGKQTQKNFDLLITF